MLDVRNLSYAPAGALILDHVSLSVGKGEFVALIGPNGAGKSTLLRHAAGVLPPPRGTLFLDGRDRSDLDARTAARIAAYVPQAREPDIPFTAGEIVLQARYPRLSTWGRQTEEDRRRAAAAMEEVGIDAMADRVFATLSGGEQQKVLLAAAIAQDASILLLDEPTTFLDPPGKDEIFRLMEGARRRWGIALLVVTHDINRASVCADRIVALREGRVVSDGVPGEVATAGVLREVYGSEFLLAAHPVSGRPMVLPRIGGEEG